MSEEAYDDFEVDWDAELADDIVVEVDPKLAAEVEAQLVAEAELAEANNGQLPGLPKAKPARDEYMAGLSNYDDLTEAPELIYHSKIFCLSQSGGPESEEYHRFINELLNKDIQHNMLFQGRDPVTNWYEGDLLIWVEWVVIPAFLPENLNPDTMDY